MHFKHVTPRNDCPKEAIKLLNPKPFVFLTCSLSALQKFYCYWYCLPLGICNLVNQNLGEMWLFSNKTMKSRKRISICTGVGAWPLRIFFSRGDYFWSLTLTRDLNAGEISKEATDTVAAYWMSRLQANPKYQRSIHVSNQHNFWAMPGVTYQKKKKKVSLKRKSKRGNQKVNHNSQELGRGTASHSHSQQLPPQPPHRNLQGPTPCVQASSRSS